MATKKVLIADDNTFIRKLVCAALQPLGCSILEATNGEEALLAVQEHAPDLVLLDLVMPKLSGFEVLAALRSREETAGCVVVMLTTAASETDLSEGKRHNVAGYIVKPFNNAELRATVAELLKI